MRSGALILGITVSAMLLAAAGTLYWMAASQGGAPYRAAIDQVREVQRLSAAWSVEIARVRADPLADFDSLAAFVPRMARLKEDLAATAQGIPELSDRLAADVNVYLAVADAQEERIERFKTGYAVVRNSARYLPIAASNVARQAQEVADAGLAQRIATLTQDMNLYLATPSDAGKGRLGEELGRLREASVGYAPPLANALANLLAHAEVLLARQAPTDALFEQATSDELGGLADRLAGALSREQGQREALARRFEQGILGLLGVLAVFWVVLAVQQRARGAGEPAVAAGAEGAGAVRAPAPGASVAPGVGGAGELAVTMAVPAAPGVEGIGPTRAPAPGAEPAAVFAPAPGAAAPAGLGAESAMLYRLLAERVGGNLAASAGRVATRLDYLRQTHHKLQHALQGTEHLPELPGGADLDEELEAGATIAAHLRREVNAIADLSRRLASFSGLTNGDAERTMVDVNACIEEVVAATGAGVAAEVNTRLGAVPELFASRTEVRLLLAQVVDNAVQAVGAVEGRAGSIKIDTVARGDEIAITVIDNGEGIPAERRKQIFRPFYTTREGALGLGLTVVAHLVKKYEGGVKVNSLPGQGTVARITLPTLGP